MVARRLSRSVPGSARRLTMCCSNHAFSCRAPRLGDAVVAPRQAGSSSSAASLPHARMSPCQRSGHAEQVGDHRHGQLGRVGVDQVEGRAVAGHPVEQRLGHLDDAGLERGHRPRGELLGHQAAVAGVVGRVDGEQRRRVHRAERVRVHDRLEQAPAQRWQLAVSVADAEVGGAQHLVGGGVRRRARHQLGLQHRAGCAHPLVGRERVGVERRIGHQPGQGVALPTPRFR